MALFDWLFDRSAKIDAPAPDPADRVQWLDTPIPKWEPKAPDPALPSSATAAESEPVAPPQFSMENVISLGDSHVSIEYRDASGNESTRNITMQSIGVGPNGPIIKAICHTRRAVRHFRTDRIRNIITTDGEVMNPARFFQDVHRVDLLHLENGDQRDALETARRLRDFLRPALSILVAAAKTDDDFHPRELEAILAYVSAELPHLREMDKFSRIVETDELKHLETMIRTMRPLEKSISGYLDSLMSQRAERIERFCKAINAVVRADGIVTVPEETFLEDLDALRVQLQLAEHHELQIIGINPAGVARGPINRRRMFNPEARRDD